MSVKMNNIICCQSCQYLITNSKNINKQRGNAHIVGYILAL